MKRLDQNFQYYAFKQRQELVESKNVCFLEESRNWKQLFVAEFLIFRGRKFYQRYTQ